MCVVITSLLVAAVSFLLSLGNMSSPLASNVFFLSLSQCQKSGRLPCSLRVTRSQSNEDPDRALPVHPLAKKGEGGGTRALD